MPRSAPKTRTSTLLLTTLLSVVAVVATLYLAQDFLKPLALALLLCFILTPGCQWLERRLGLNRVVSTLSMVSLAGLIILAVGWIVTLQVSELAADLPSYRTNIERKINAIGGIANRLLEQGTHIAREVRSHLTPTQFAPPSTQPVAIALPGSPAVTLPLPIPPPTTAPTPVEVVSLPGDDSLNSPLSIFFGYLTPVLSFFGTFAIIVIYVIFILIKREDLRDRLISLLSRRRIGLTTDALDDAASRVSRYLLMLCIINGSYGLAAALGLWMIGLPAAALWGLLCAILRFIPYIGPWIAASFPVMLAVAIGETWWMPLTTIGMFVFIEIISNNIVEPVLYGRGTGVSPIAVILAAVFWTWLWGAPGLLMATPLTVCAAVAGKHVKSLQFLFILLGDQPALPAPLRYYQRLLANDDVESATILRSVSAEAGLLAAFEEVALPSLITAERDARRGWIEPNRFREVLDRIRDQVGTTSKLARSDQVVSAAKGVSPDESAACEIITVGQTPLHPVHSPDLNHHATDKPLRRKLRLFRRRNRQVSLGGRQLATTAKPGQPTSPTTTNTAAGLIQLSRTYATPPRLPRDVHPRVLILPARDEPDEIAGHMLAGLLDLVGYHTEVLSIDHLASEMAQKVRDARPDLIIISATPPSAVIQARYLYKRLPRDIAPILVTLWSPNRPVSLLQQRLNPNEKLPLANTLCTAIEQARTLSAPAINRLLNPLPEPTPDPS